MTAEEYLSQLQNLDECIRQDFGRLEDLRNRAKGDKAIDYSGVKVQVSAEDRMCDSVCNLVTLEEKIVKEINRLADAKELIISQIRELKDVKAMSVLYSVYVEYRNISDTGRKLKMCNDSVKKYRDKGLHDFIEMYKGKMYFLLSGKPL